METNEKSKVNYFELNEDINDFKYAISSGEKVKSGLKIGGKVLGNIGLFTCKLGFSIVKNMPTILEEQAKKIEKKNTK